MAIIGNKIFTDGDIPNAAQLNLVYDNLQAGTVNADNTDRQWANREHLDLTAKLNRLDFFNYTSVTTFSTSSTTEVIMEPGGTKIRVQPNYTPSNDFVLRVQCDGTVTEPIQTVLGASTSNALDDLYQFIIQVESSIGTENIAYANYSFGKLAYATTDGAPAAWPDPLWYRNWNVSAIKAYPAGTQIIRINVFVKVGNGANTLVTGFAKVFTQIMEG